MVRRDKTAADAQVTDYLREGQEVQMTKDLAMSDAGKGLLQVIRKTILGKQRGLEGMQTSSMMGDLISEARFAYAVALCMPSACLEQMRSISLAVTLCPAPGDPISRPLPWLLIMTLPRSSVPAVKTTLTVPCDRTCTYCVQLWTALVTRCQALCCCRILSLAICCAGRLEPDGLHGVRCAGNFTTDGRSRWALSSRARPSLRQSLRSRLRRPTWSSLRPLSRRRTPRHRCSVREHHLAQLLLSPWTSQSRQPSGSVMAQVQWPLNRAVRAMKPGRMEASRRGRQSMAKRSQAFRHHQRLRLRPDQG